MTGDLIAVSSIGWIFPQSSSTPDSTLDWALRQADLRSPPIATAPLHVVVAEDVAIAAPDLEPWVLVHVVANVATDEADT